MEAQSDKPKRTFKVGEDMVDIPSANVDSFLSDFPDAEEMSSYIVGEDTVDIPMASVDQFLADFPDAKPTFSTPEKKSPIGSPSQDGSQGLQGGPASPSRGVEVPDQPLAGLGGVDQGAGRLGVIGQTIEQGPQKGKGEYILDGQPVSDARMQKALYDKSFMETIAKSGELNRIQIAGDDAMSEIARRQLESFATNDYYDSLVSSLARAGQMVTGSVDYANDLMSELTGIPNTLYTLAGAAAGPEMAAKGASGELNREVASIVNDFTEKAKEAQDSRFQVEGDFIDQVAKAYETGSSQDIGDAFNTAINTTLESAAPMALIALGNALTGGGSSMMALAKGGAAVTPFFIGGEYAEQKAQMKDIKERYDKSQAFMSTSEVPTEDELALMNMSRAVQLFRPIPRGAAEMGGEVVSTGIWKGTSKVATEAAKSFVKKTFGQFGKEAAEEVAEVGAKELAKRFVASLGVEPAKEGFAEFSTFMAQELTDVLLGVSTKSPARIAREAANAFALGAASGGVMTAPGRTVTGIALGAKGLSSAKKYLDNILAFDPQGRESLNEAVRGMEESGMKQQAEEIKTNLAKREKAVKSVPKEKVADTETVDKVQKKQELQEEMSGLDPVYQEPIKEEIAAIDNELREGIKKEYPAPRVFSTPTDQRYAVVNRGDGNLDLTKEEYLAEMERRGTPVEEVAAEVPQVEVPTEEPTPSMPDQLPGTKITQEGEYDLEDPYTYQELRAEPLIRKSKEENGTAAWDSNSNLVRLRIENAGDILRELSLRGTSADRNYLYEKINNLRDYFGKLKGRDLHADDKPFGAMNRNEDLFKALRKAWYGQPTSNDAEAAVRRLVLELADGNSDGNSLNRALDNVVAEVEKFVPVRETQSNKPTPATPTTQPVTEPVSESESNKAQEQEAAKEGQAEAVQEEVGATEPIAPSRKKLNLSELAADLERERQADSVEGELLNMASLYNSIGNRKRKDVIGNKLMSDMQNAARKSGYQIRPGVTGRITILDPNGKEVVKKRGYVSSEKKAEKAKERKEDKQYRKEVLNADPVSVEHFFAMALADGKNKLNTDEVRKLLGKNYDIPSWMIAENGMSIQPNYIASLIRDAGFGMDQEAEVNAKDVEDAIMLFADERGRQKAFGVAEEIYIESQRKKDSYAEMTEEDAIEMYEAINRQKELLEGRNDVYSNLASIEELTEEQAQALEDEILSQEKYEASTQFIKDAERYATGQQSEITQSEVGQAEASTDGDRDAGRRVEVERPKEGLTPKYKEGSTVADRFKDGLLATTVFEGGELNPNNPKHVAAWRSMGPKEFMSILEGKKYGGSGPKKGAWFASSPKLSASITGKDKFLVEYGGVETDNEASPRPLGREDITGVWRYDGKKWQKMSPSDVDSHYESQKQPTKSSAEIAKSIRDKKITGTLFVDPLFGGVALTKAVYNGALELAAKLVEQNTAAGAVIETVVKYIEDAMKGKSFKREALETDVKKRLWFIDPNAQQLYEGLKDLAREYGESVGNRKPTVNGLHEYIRENADPNWNRRDYTQDAFNAIFSGAPKPETAKPAEKQTAKKPATGKDVKEAVKEARAEEPQGKPKVPKTKKGESVKRYTTRVVNDLKELSDKKALEDAVRATGLTRATVPWKEVQPIALEIVEDIFSDPKKVSEKMDALYNTILVTATGEYILNPKLSTLHSLIFHAATDRMKNEGMDADYLKWVAAFQAIGESNGRFTSAMQQDASEYAVRNLIIRPLFNADNAKMQEETDTGTKRSEDVTQVKELLDQIMQDEKLMELYEKRIKELEGQLEKAAQEQFYTDAPRQQAPSLTKEQQLKKQKSDALAKIRRGIAKTRGQLSAGIPIDSELIDGMIELARYYVSAGIYEAAKIKRAVMKEVDKDFKNNPDALIQIADAIDEFLASDEFKEGRNETMKQAFAEALENRAKSLLGNKRAQQKSAEQVLLDSLLAKIGAGIGSDAKQGSKAYQQRIKEAIENMEFSDEVWRAAIKNVSMWMASQDIDPATKAEILARLEDTASTFMEKPYAKADIRRAIRDGEKDLGISIAEVVKRHFSEQNKALETLAEKLVSELGLSAEAAKRYEQAVIEEARSYMDDKRMSAIQKALSLDKAGSRKEKSEKVNKRIIDQMIEGINLGMLDDDTFRGLFAEKYGLSDLSPEAVRNINRFNDLIHMHEGTDVARAYTKQLADYIETLKPWNAASFAKTTQSMVIKGILNGISTFLNISAGSVYSFVAGSGPSVLGNPAAALAFFKEYSKAGLSGTSRKMFADIMIDGRSPIDEGLGGKFDDADIYGDRFDHFVRTYNPKKLREMASNAKTPKEVGFTALVVIARTYSLLYQASNFAKAFDVLLSNRGVEFEMFLKEYNELSKEAGHPLRGRFDPSVSKKFIERLREKMGYDPETKAEIEASVDEQILGMKARGERIGFGTRKALIREAMIARRDMMEYKQAQERVRSFLLMEDPTGVLGALYDLQRGAGSIKGDEGTWKTALKLGYSLTLGLFLRISMTATQRSLENIPLAGLMLPGVFYDRTSTDPSNPRAKKKWMTYKGSPLSFILEESGAYDRQLMKRRIATHAIITGLTAAAAWNMFSLRDDEEEEEQEDGSFKVVKKKRLDLNPDRVIELTGHSGQFFEAEQYSQEGDRRKDFYFRAKVGGKWENIAPIRLNPNFLFSSAVLGGMADEIKMKPDEDIRKRDLILKSADDLALALSEFSFATNAKLIRKTFYAAEREGMPGAAAEIGEFVLRPARNAIYPNALRDIYKETRAWRDMDEKIGSGVINDMPILEDMMGESTYDIFGNPKKVTSKFIEVGSDIPVAGVIVNNLIDYKYRNEERFETEAWQRKMKYFPNVKIDGYWVKGFERSTQIEASRIYGEMLKEQIEGVPESWFEERSPQEIDAAINGRIMPDGSRKGGIHSQIVSAVKVQMGMNELKDADKFSAEISADIRSILREKDPQKRAQMQETLDALLKEKEEQRKVQKELQEKLKPKKPK